MTTTDRFAVARKVAILGIVANVFLLAIKLYMGYASGSNAMIADGFNSAGDVFASLVTLIGSVIASRPGDERHFWGHRKAEYIAAIVISFSMILVAYSTAISSVQSLVANNVPVFSYPLIITAAVTIGIKLVLYIYCSKKGKRLKSLIILSNSTDHRNDIFLSSATLISIVLGRFGIGFADGVAGCLIALFIGWSGVKIMLAASSELMDVSLPDEVVSLYEKQIMELGDIAHIDSIRSKSVGGGQYLVIVKMSVDKNMSVLKSHMLGKDVETVLLENHDVHSVVCHINPDTEHNPDKSHMHS